MKLNHSSQHRIYLHALCALALLLFSTISHASDWPMWGHDAQRSSITATELPADLNLQWELKLTKPDTAWPPSQKKLQFDAAYEPVVAGNRLFIGSMNNDSMTAYDLATGKKLWRYFTEGPIRLAPIAANGNVYFGSDDGHLYCVTQDVGKLIWKFRAGPSDRRLLGNDRLINMWPVRGAPVLHEGTIYFAAGIWPFMGTFIHALNAKTGETIWTNSGSGSTFHVQQHNSPAFAGVAPQGYIAVSGEQLIVSGGRSVPAVYSKDTGEFQYYQLANRHFGKDAGGYGVRACASSYLNGGVLYSLPNGAGIAKIGPGLCTDLAAFSVNGKKLTISKLPVKKIERKNKRGVIETAFKLEQEVIHEFKAATLPLLMTGNILYTAQSNGTIEAVRIGLSASSKATKVWTGKVPGKPRNAIAANGKLIVTTSEGGLYCFGAGAALAKKTQPAATTLPASDNWKQYLEPILATVDDDRGYCVVAGPCDPELIFTLIQQSQFHVIIITPTAESANQLRSELDRANLYGSRASVIIGDVFTTPLPPYFATLVLATEKQKNLPASAKPSPLLDSLRPYGGAAWFPKSSRLAKFLDTQHILGAKQETTGDDLRLVRPGALPDSASWTHQYADSANSVVSKDKLVKLPLGVLWYGGPPNDLVLPRHGHGPSPQVIGGRLFIEGRHMLRAVDVYTGRLLWQRELKDIGKFYDNTAHHPGANEIGSNYVSVSDGIYVVTPETCRQLDPATGETIREFTVPTVPGDPDPSWGFISVHEDLLIATLSPIQVSTKATKKGKKPAKKTKAKTKTTPLIPKEAEWEYLGGSHPDQTWTRADFKPAPATANKWKSGPAGFGYGDSDDSTVLKDMRNTYTAVYLRKSFELNPRGDETLQLKIRYDDAFVAYLNGKEIARSGVTGTGAKASKIQSHEASAFETFTIADAKKILRKGENILAIEGHNRGASSSDFTLDPYLDLVSSVGTSAKPETAKPETTAPQKALPDLASIPEVKINAAYSSASATLAVFNRHTGEYLWSRSADHNFRHNAIAAAEDAIFCIDRMSNAKLATLQRRGYAPEKKAALYALNAKTGEVIWQTSDAVFGTWLSYSQKHDLLIQTGSQARDRARDEAGRGYAAYQAKTGKLLWRNEAVIRGPALLHHDLIISEGSAMNILDGTPATRRDPISGKQVPWVYSRNYGCNTPIASEHLLTFRSAAAVISTSIPSPEPAT